MCEPMALIGFTCTLYLAINFSFPANTRLPSNEAIIPSPLTSLTSLNT